ncbi:MAG TPA: hypothetical protein VH092_24760 [Urbifossiella sp.]|jgi:hypothetical protein|nr:hypothetical protein [Urbifossiella sp.]
MKFLVQVGLVAVTLFSVSAALSVWLYQSRLPQSADADHDKVQKAKGKEPESERPAPKESEKTPRPVDLGPTPAGADQTALSVLRDREARADRRAAQVELVLRDLQFEREANETLLRQAATELKQAAAKAAEAATAPRPADVEKLRAEAEAAEAKNIDRMSKLFDSMAPEAAAPILLQMANSGKLDTAARVLVQMKERQAARLLGELGDTNLAAQLLDRMRLLRPLPGTGATPAGGAALPPGRNPAP